MLGRSFTPKYGVNVTATTHDVSSAIQTTQKRFLQYSPAPDCAKPTGIRPIIVTSVPASIGAAVWLQAKLAALIRAQPSSSLTTIVSIPMIASSTSRPREGITAPKEIRKKPLTVSTSITTVVDNV